MSKCDVSISLNREDGRYSQGERIQGTVQVQVREGGECKKLELSLGWSTSGQGSTDRGYYEIRTLFSGRWTEGQTYSYPFELDAPVGPLSYRGQILSVNWRLIARADVPWIPSVLDPKAERTIEVTPIAGHRDVDYGPSYQRPEQRDERQQQMRRFLKTVAWFCAITGSFMILVAILTSLPDDAGSTGPTWFLFGLCDFVIGGGFYYFGTRKTLAERRLGRVEARVVPTIVNRGGMLNCVIGFCPRETVDIEAVTARLIGEERAVDNSGDSQTTHRKTICDDEIVASTVQRMTVGKRVVLTPQLSVPADAAITFAAPSNSVNWKVRLRIAVKGWPDWVEDYPITVRP
jgi:hypothetical protein